MRTFLTGESAVVGGTMMRNALRVKIANGSGTFIDYSAYVVNVEIDYELDQLAPSFSLGIRRDIGTQSLSPLRLDSTLNRLDGGITAAPAIDVGRRVTIETATVAVSATPAGTDWKMMFDGTIDDWDAAGSTIQINGRDRIIANLLDRWTTSGTAFGVAGDALETVMQGFLDIYGGSPTVTLYVPTSPLFELSKPFTFEEPVNAMEALKSMADAKGWRITSRFRESTGAFQLTLDDPLRSKTTPDYTLAGSRYISVNKLAVDRDYIRNGGFLEYTVEGAATTSTVLPTPTAAIDASVLRYGYRPLFIREDASTSPIDTAVEAQALLDAIMLDTVDPKAEQEIEMHYFWAVEINDLLRFSANGVHYSEDQDWAITRVHHSLSEGKHRTSVSVRGKPASGFLTWVARGSDPAPDTAVRVFRVVNFRETDRTATAITLKWELGEVIPDELWLYRNTVTQPVSGDPWSGFVGLPAVRLTGTTTEYTFSIPKVGEITFGRLVPVSLTGDFGNPWDFTLQPNNNYPSISLPIQTIAAAGLTTDLSITLSDPAGLGGTFYVWTNHSLPDDADSTATYEGSLAVASTTSPYAVNQTHTFTLSGGGTSALLNDIKVHAGQGKLVYAEFVNSAGVSSGVQTIPLRPSKPPVNSDGVLNPGIITDVTQFASNISPVQIVTALPAAGSITGHVVFLTTDKRMYRWTGSAWEAVVAEFAGTIDTAQIADSAVTSAKIGALAVTEAKVAADAITVPKIGSLAVTEAKIAAAAITEAKLGAAAVTTAKLALLAVDSTILAAAAVTTAKLALLAVDSTILAAGAVTTTKITDDAVTTAKIVAAAITTAKLSASAVTSNELAAGSVIAGKIAAGTIVAADIAAATITGAKLVAETITAAQIAAGTITATELAADSVTAVKILAGSVTTAKVAAGAITATEIGADAVTAVKILAGSITTAKIAAGAVTATEIAAGAIIAGKIGALAIVAGDIAANTITGAKIAANTITASNIAADTITAGEIAAAAIGTTELAAGAVTATKISVGTLSAISADIGTVTAGKVQNSAGTYYVDLNASGASSFIQTPNFVVKADGVVTVSALKFSGQGSAPSLSSVHAYWSGGGAISGTDTAGKVTLTRNSGVSGGYTSGSQVTVTFTTAYAAAPFVFVSGTADVGSGVQVTAGNVTTTSFTIDVTSDSTLINTAAHSAVVKYLAFG